MSLGIYAGSFNPFHKGHYNILLKAESMFDKVIIARGINPDKSPSTYPLPNILKDKTIMEYSGLLTDFLNQLYLVNNVTPILIRGLRNANDFEYELIQYRYFQDLMPEIKVVSLFCDKEYDHISSSGIRTLTKYGEDKVKNYLLE